MNLIEKYLCESSYADDIPGISKKAFDLFKTYSTTVDIKELGFKKFNVNKASITMSSLDDKQRAIMLKHLMGNEGHAKIARELEKIIPTLKKKWKEIQRQAHLDFYGEEPTFGSYKVSGVGDSGYSEKYKKQLRTLAHMETAFKYAIGGHKKVK